jgi:hypothetical protein
MGCCCCSGHVQKACYTRMPLTYSRKLSRAVQLCNFLDWRNLKLVYKRYASLYFLCAVDESDNELIILDMIHHFVEVLDKHFSNVCELDLVFNFYKAYWLLDEVFLAGASSIQHCLHVLLPELDPVQ